MVSAFCSHGFDLKWVRSWYTPLMTPIHVETAVQCSRMSQAVLAGFSCYGNSTYYMIPQIKTNINTTINSQNLNTLLREIILGTGNIGLFLCVMAYQSLWVIYCQNHPFRRTPVTLPNCGDKAVQTFPKGINLEEMVIVWLEFELDYSDITVEYFGQWTFPRIRNSPSYLVGPELFEDSWHRYRERPANVSKTDTFRPQTLACSGRVHFISWCLRRTFLWRYRRCTRHLRTNESLWATVLHLLSRLKINALYKKDQLRCKAYRKKILSLFYIKLGRIKKKRIFKTWIKCTTRILKKYKNY